jgi:hypothetical protein
LFVELGGLCGVKTLWFRYFIMEPGSGPCFSKKKQSSSEKKGEPLMADSRPRRTNGRTRRAQASPVHFGAI